MTFGASSVLPLLNNRGVLRIGGIITGPAGSFNNIASGNVVGSVELNGTCNGQTVNGNIFVNNAINNLTVSNAFTASMPVGVTISPAAGEQIEVYGTLAFGNVLPGFTCILNTSTNLILKSSASRTANVAPILGTHTIVGSVTVERYIHTGLAAASGSIPAQHHRSWQFLATPTGSATTGQTINQSWQENEQSFSFLNSLGTWLTAPSGSTGFDAFTSTPSLKYWDPVSGYIGITNTGNQLFDQRGYFVFVHGDRNVQVFSGPGSDPNPTILRQTGPLYQPSNPPPSSSVSGSGLFLSVGNPYASAIDLRYLRDNGFFSGFTNDVTIWDPINPGSLGYGDFITLAAANDYEPIVPPTPSIYYPASRECWDLQSGQAFLLYSNASGATVSFDENCKIGGSRLVNKSVSPLGRKIFRAYLSSSTGICDGNAVAFHHSYRKEVDADDAHKMLNPGENFIITRGADLLAVEARAEIEKSDTVFYSFSNLRKMKYQLQFAPKNLQTSHLQVFLVDNYLKKQTQLSNSDSSFFDFVVDENKKSFEDRFYVVFQEEFNSRPGSTRRDAVMQPVKEDGYNTPAICVYPNPVENRQLRLRFSHQYPGSYRLNLIDNAGRVVFETTLQNSAKDALKTVTLPPGIAAGNYYVSLTAENGHRFQQPVFVK